MNMCEKYTESISAYADGQMSSESAQIVETHISECDKCSALFKYYKEISEAVKETTVSPPESLALSVMKKINEIPAARRNIKNRRVNILRFMSVAACLAVVLTVLFVYRNSFGFPGYVDNAESGLGGMPADSMRETADYDNVYTNQASIGAYTEDSTSRQAQTEAAMHDNTAITAYFEGASYIITIEGGLPAYLADAVPEITEQLSGNQQIYLIPSGDVQILIDELAEMLTRSAAMTNFNAVLNETNSDSAFAVVLYTP